MIKSKISKCRNVDLLAVTIFVTSTTLLPPINIAFTNVNSVTINFWNFLPAIFGFNILLSAILILCLGQFKKIQNYLSICLIFLGICGFIESSFLINFYNSFDGGLLAKISSNLIMIYELTFFVSALILAIFLAKNAQALFKFTLLLVSIQFIFTAFIIPFNYGIYKNIFKPNYVDIKSSNEIFSEKNNIIIFIVDTLQSQAAYNSIISNDSLKKDFADFTQYINTSAEFPFTAFSIPSVLTNELFLNKSSYKDYIKNSYSGGKSILRNAMKNGYYVELTRWEKATPIPRDPQLYSNIRTETNRITEVEILWLMWLYQISPNILKEKIGQSLTKKLFGLREQDSNTIFHFRSNFKETKKSGMSVLKLIHLKGGHIPLAANGENLSQTNENYELVVKSILSDIARYISSMKASGVYENSTIIILGDHGAGLQKISIKIPQIWDVSSESPFVKGSLHNAALPAMLIKPPSNKTNKTGSAFSINDDAHTLRNINFFLNNLIMNPKNNHTIELPIEEERMLYYPLNAEININGRAKPMHIHHIKGAVFLLKSWGSDDEVISKNGKVNKIIPLRTDQITFGENGNSRIYQSFGWGEQRNGFTWTSGKQARLKIPFNLKNKDSITLTFSLIPLVIDKKLSSQDINIYVNNVFTTSWSLSKYGDYKLTIPAKIIKDGVNLIDFELPSATSGKLLNINDDIEILAIQFLRIVIN